VRKMRKALIGEVRDRVRDLANTEAFQRSCRELRKVEMRFAHMKRILKLDRSLGLTGVKMNAHRFGQNLRRLAKLHWRPPPNTSSSPA
jgi:hypothetical protein